MVRERERELQSRVEEDEVRERKEILGSETIRERRVVGFYLYRKRKRGRN